MTSCPALANKSLSWALNLNLEIIISPHSPVSLLFQELPFAYGLVQTSGNTLRAIRQYTMADNRKTVLPNRAKMNEAQLEHPVKADTIPGMDENNAFAVAQAGGWEIDALINEMEQEVEAAGGLRNGFFDLEFKQPKHFTWLIVAFASMGGLLSGLDQSLISGANLYLPKDLGLDTRQNSLVNSAMPLGAVGGAIILSPCNETFGRRWSIIISTILYTIGAALEAGSINYGKSFYNTLGSNQLTSEKA